MRRSIWRELRAVEPAHVDTQAYARFLPATTSAVTLYGVSIAANFARVNDVAHSGGLQRWLTVSPSSTCRRR